MLSAERSVPKRPTLDELPVFQNYSCHACGQCCRGNLAVLVTPAEADMIVGQGWLDDPDYAGRQLFVERGGNLYFAQNGDEGCVFLDPAGGCRIHARFGLEGKPLSCRFYPHLFIPAGDGVRVDVRFDCVSVAGNKGVPLSDQRAYLEAVLPEVVPEIDLEPVPLRPGVDWGQSQLDRVSEALDTLMTSDELDITRRVIAAVNLAAVLDNPAMAAVDDDQLDLLLAAAIAKLLDTMPNDGLQRLRPPRGVRAMFRQTIGLYGRIDRISRRVPTGERLRQALALASGRGGVPALRPEWPAVAFEQLEGAWGIPDGDAAATLVRFYRVKLAAQSFCGAGFFGADYLPGVLALWLTYPVILWMARLYAVGDGRQEVTDADVQLALQVVDHRHGRTPQQALPGEQSRLRALSDRDLLRALVVWYGT